MAHNETLEFLLTQGWEVRTSSSDKILRHPDMDEETWYSINEALEIEKINCPEVYHEWELLTSLEPRLLSVVNEYFDS
jgi:hypothetical protein